MKRILHLVALLCLAFSAFSQDDAYTSCLYVSESGDSLNYRMLEPESPKAGMRYPLVIFLHGAGERGTDNVSQLTHGSGMFLNPVNRELYPSFVVFPQCPPDGYWAYPSRPDSFKSADMPVDFEISHVFRTLMGLVGEMLARPDVDTSRVYIVGLSMGAMGTYDLACRFPDIFAAAVPICGTVNPARLPAARSVAFRIFHGDADDIVPVEGSRNAYRALKAVGADVEYVEFPGCNHGSWNPAFNMPDFMEWLYAQRRE